MKEESPKIEYEKEASQIVEDIIEKVCAQESEVLE